MSLQLMLPAPIEGQQAAQMLTSSTAELQLSQTQSLCLVKIFLNASLGCICFARGLIRSDSPAYQDRRVDDLMVVHRTSVPASYDDFFSFQGPLSLNVESQQFKVLLRGKDKRVDHILNLVENGVFDALERGYLEAVQFSLSYNSSRRQEVIECYTFSFSYAEFEGYGRQVRSVKVTAAAEDHFYVTGAQKSFRKAIHNLLVLCQELPPLPRHRSLGVNLLYNSTCPPQYEPSGFAGSADAGIFPLSSTTKEAGPISAFQVSSYKVVVTLTKAQLAHGDASGSSRAPQEVDPTSSRLRDIAIRNQLQAMQRSSSIPSNLIMTQTAHGLEGAQSASQPVLYTPTPPDFPAAQSTDWSSRSKRNITATKMAELIVQAWGVEGHNPSFIYLLDMDQLRKNNKIKRLKPGNDIGCECRSDHKEDAMTLCELCGLWQHNNCYGLQRYPPEKKPNEHICYSCLLLPQAEPLNNKMPSLVRMRLALSHIYDRQVEVVEREQLINAVHLPANDHTTYLELVVKLEDEGFIRKNRGNETVVVVKEQTKIADARSNYMDPLACISDYYEAGRDQETVQERAKAIQEALERYTDGRSLDMGLDVPELDEWICEDAFGRQITRWGFYFDSNEAPHPDGSRKRRSSSGSGPGAKKCRTGRKMSISKTMVNLDMASETSSDIEDEDIGTIDTASMG